MMIKNKNLTKVGTAGGALLGGAAGYASYRLANKSDIKKLKDRKENYCEKHKKRGRKYNKRKRFNFTN